MLLTVTMQSTAETRALVTVAVMLRVGYVVHNDSRLISAALYLGGGGGGGGQPVGWGGESSMA